MYAKSSGRPGSARFNGLLPSNTYYICIKGEKRADYSLAVCRADQMHQISTDKVNASANESLQVSSNPDSSVLLNINDKYNGRYESGINWFAFTTDEDSGISYWVTLQNLSADSDTLEMSIYDEVGNLLKVSDGTNYNSGSGSNTMYAKTTGIPGSGRFNYLLPSNTYYICIKGEKSADFAVFVYDHE